jgi:hypothetical protein
VELVNGWTVARVVLAVAWLVICVMSWRYYRRNPLDDFREMFRVVRETVAAWKS